MRPRTGGQATIHEFGNKLDGIDYIDRPGVYAVIRNTDEQVAVMETGHGYFLPGGGIDPGEAEVDALKRELVEEIGYQASLVAEIGVAVDYVEAAGEGKYYRIRSTFYTVRLASRIGEGTEPDHRLLWRPPEEALKLLTRQSQVWAVQGLRNM